MEIWSKILSVAIGGALGAVTRYLVSSSPLHNLFDKFPFHTFLINIVGSFLLGFLVVFLTEKIVVSEHLRIALTVGFLGAFTTFSTFELETFHLIRERQISTALFYVAASVVVGFLGVVVGIWLGRKI